MREISSRILSLHLLENIKDNCQKKQEALNIIGILHARKNTNSKRIKKILWLTTNNVKREVKVYESLILIGDFNVRIGDKIILEIITERELWTSAQQRIRENNGQSTNLKETDNGGKMQQSKPQQSRNELKMKVSWLQHVLNENVKKEEVN